MNKNFNYVREINDPRLGEICKKIILNLTEIYQEKTSDKQIFVKSTWANSEEDYHDFITYCKKRKALSHKNLISMFAY